MLNKKINAISWSDLPQQMESNIEIIIIFPSGKRISIRNKAWKADRIEQLYGEGGKEKGW